MPLEIRKIMKSPVQTVHHQSPVIDAVKLMKELSIRHLPVVDDESKIVGVVSDRDLREVVVDYDNSDASNWAPDSTLVSQVMASEPVVVTPSEDLRRALKILEAGSFSSLPVVDGGELVGIVTSTDLLRAFVKLLDHLEARAK